MRCKHAIIREDTFIACLLNQVAGQQTQQAPAQTSHRAKHTPDRRHTIRREKICRKREEHRPFDLNSKQAKTDQRQRQGARRCVVGRDHREGDNTAPSQITVFRARLIVTAHAVTSAELSEPPVSAPRSAATQGNHANMAIARRSKPRTSIRYCGNQKQEKIERKIAHHPGH